MSPVVEPLESEQAAHKAVVAGRARTADRRRAVVVQIG